LHAPTGTARYAAHEDLFECPTGCGWRFEQYWPEQFGRPTSPELDRLREINAVAVERSRARYREMGRQILADLDSGVRWQQELEHRAYMEEHYYGRGPIVEVIRP
jgi:hypothetical protein